MKQNIYCLLFVTGLLAATRLPAQYLYIGSNAKIISAGPVTITLNNMGVNNNGAFANTGNTIIFTGNNATQPSILKGTNLQFNSVIINRQAGDVLLNTNIAVNGNMSFGGGNVQLNSYNIDLGAANGALVGESETSRVTGVNGGLVLKTATLTSPYAANPGNIGVYITSPASLGSTLIKRGHAAQTVSSGITGINRYFEITPANNSNIDVSLQFNYFDAELNGIAEPALNFWGSNNGGSTWSFLGNDGSTATLNLVLKTGFTSLGRVTLAAQTASLLPPPVVRRDTSTDVTILNVFPNPAKDYVTVLFSSKAEKNYAVALYSQAGQLLEVKNVHAIKGFNQVTWLVQKYAGGMYYYKFTNQARASAAFIKAD
jgi:hypothetical protein